MSGTPFSSVQEAFQQIMSELTGDLHADTGQFENSSSKSFVFLDAKTINLILLYILMNKELQLTRLTNRTTPSVLQKNIAEEIDKMMKENKQLFEEILKEWKK
ncbi:shikimate kinase [Sporosarcina luteola]|nr:shikimate kinase [Sporosarcina luteola]